MKRFQKYLVVAFGATGVVLIVMSIVLYFYIKSVF